MRFVRPMSNSPLENTWAQSSNSSLSQILSSIVFLFLPGGLHGSLTCTELTGHLRLFVLVSCTIKLITLSFWVHVKLCYRIVLSLRRRIVATDDYWLIESRIIFIRQFFLQNCSSQRAVNYFYSTSPISTLSNYRGGGFCRNLGGK